jgi:hypothetical protein
LLIEGNLFRTLRAGHETQDEIDAHLGVTQPGQPNPDPSPVLVLLDYVEATWTGGSKIHIYSGKLNLFAHLTLCSQVLLTSSKEELASRKLVWGGGVEVHSGSQNKKYSTVSAIKKATPQKNFLSYSQHLDGL